MPRDRGLIAWSQVFAGHLVVFNSWGYPKLFQPFPNILQHVSRQNSFPHIVDRLYTEFSHTLHGHLFRPCNVCRILPSCCFYGAVPTDHWGLQDVIGEAILATCACARLMSGTRQWSCFHSYSDTFKCFLYFLNECRAQRRRFSNWKPIEYEGSYIASDLE